MRDFVEYLVKQVRNGQINYGYADPGGTVQSALPAPCSAISSVNYLNAAGYALKDNKLGLLDTESNEICLYYAKADNTYVGDGNFSSAAPGNGVNIVVAKGSSPIQVLNASNFKVMQAMFFVRPLKDPYAPGNPKWQPVVTIAINFRAMLPTGEQVPIYYQTSVSTSKYDIPNSP